MNGYQVCLDGGVSSETYSRNARTLKCKKERMMQLPVHKFTKEEFPKLDARYTQCVSIYLHDKGLSHSG